VGTLAREVTFAEPPEYAVRAAANSPIRRYNPFWSWQKDGDYAVTRSLGGLLSRHDRKSVGAADRFLFGMLAESRRTTSFRKWELGGGLIVKHVSEARRGTTKTTWLPWGVLVSRSLARLPQSSDKNIALASVLWGLGSSVTRDEAGGHSVRVLPFGLLFSRATGPGRSSTHILGSGTSRQEAPDHSSSTTRFRLLGIPLWTTQPPHRTRLPGVDLADGVSLGGQAALLEQISGCARRSHLADAGIIVVGRENQHLRVRDGF
jgi:hypothetical protein